ncbi:hypothetical protein NEUTE1DRAFT_80771 [Neurospora tetrasperma FGSC 2508]|uniref:Uncharacterized protein n=1 Tax=Neurospora tetrasperma (strain FGSC 2508 / ATCC MYA-4615 / P0657) TaxID=510951 RepID=F8MJM7_NEUT8|nr:uncharacterized protein NEUTE1DRAFT_80771 [Neurospora tetrasperma FGSC 2508]EGO57268.1 hypothetical protein NEUTE1DRAFT_80771 [Neurospora tetrasperma FGSC 2508]EGZ72484.1 hypothetical protein NEUTE2DRAFT_90718 [Neurospora tetrasperma FGSC 2509]
MSASTSTLPLHAVSSQPGKTHGGRWLRSMKHFRGNGAKPPSSVSSAPTAQSGVQQQKTKTSEPTRQPPTSIAVTEAEVKEELRIHKRFQLPSIAPGIEVTDLPNFDDVTPYDVTEDTQEQLWDLEAKRLVEAITQDSPPRFEGSHDLSIDSKKAHALLAVLADRVMQCLIICSYDGENLLAQHHEARCSRSELRSCKISLGYLIGEDKEDDLSSTTDDTSKVDTVEDIKASDEDFFAFVDYCSNILARILCSAFDGRYVHVNILAHLARICTKVKILSADLKKFAEISLDRAAPEMDIPIPSQHGLRRPHDGQIEDGGPSVVKKVVVNGGGASGGVSRLLQSLESLSHDQMAPLETESKKKALRIKYCEKHDIYRTCLTKMLQKVVVHLRGTNRLTQSFPTFYEICAMVYETGFERFRTLVFQDEANVFYGTSDAVIVNYCRSGYHLLNRTLAQMSEDGSISESQITPPPASGPTASDGTTSIGTTVSWDYTPDAEDGAHTYASNPPDTIHKFFQIGSMSNIITIVVPLLLANPNHAALASDFFNTISFNNFLSGRPETTTEQNLQQQSTFQQSVYGKYTACFSLTTKEYRDEQSKRSPDGPRSLSNALMRRKNLHRGDELGEFSRVDSLAFNRGKPGKGPSSAVHTSNEDTFQRQIEDHQKELDRYGTSMKSWVFEEKGIMVKCKTYVALTMVLCTVLVGGGIAVGVTVGSSITAVDPFNITTYCWVLAAFVLLIAKSIRVHEWPWNDFLHGRVLCKSVSELSSVTGIPDRLILAKLLQDESLSRLITRGPFNAVFRRRENEGFSIDRPISMWTMLLSGLIMIEVESVGGKGLVCLDLRRGTTIEAISHTADFQDCSDEKKLYIHCRSIPGRKELTNEGHIHPNKVALNSGPFQWMRSLGFYSNKDAMFV